MRKTLKSEVEISGIGLHGGVPVSMTVAPAAAGEGISFLRVDVAPDQQTVPAKYDLVTDTRLCTKLSNAHGVSVGTVEHVMAALAGCGITDAVIALDGPEVPIMDGSSEPFVSAFIQAGIVSLGVDCAAIRILKPIRVEDSGRWAELSPADRFSMDFRIEFEDAAIGEQHHRMTLVNGAFVSELSDCRTFGHLHEVEHLRAIGLARGGNLKNAIVVDKGRVLNPEGLRRSDEFVRHKMLDAIGDLALAGAPIIGRFTGDKAGHEMTNRLLRELFQRPRDWTWDVLGPTQAMDGGLGAIKRIENAEPIAV
jgi:UDP-3-O-[3-hydroxymyristoyl] N-acetylglucosamine deacetylase